MDRDNNSVPPLLDQNIYIYIYSWRARRVFMLLSDLLDVKKGQEDIMIVKEKE